MTGQDHRAGRRVDLFRKRLPQCRVDIAAHRRPGRTDPRPRPSRGHRPHRPVRLDPAGRAQRAAQGTGPTSTRSAAKLGQPPGPCHSRGCPRHRRSGRRDRDHHPPAPRRRGRGHRRDRGRGPRHPDRQARRGCGFREGGASRLEPRTHRARRSPPRLRRRPRLPAHPKRCWWPTTAAPRR